MGGGSLFDLSVVNPNRDLKSKEGKIDTRARLQSGYPFNLPVVILIVI